MGLDEQRRMGDLGHPSGVSHLVQDASPYDDSSRFSVELRRRATASSPSRRNSGLRKEGRSLSPIGQSSTGVLFPGVSGAQTVGSMAYGHRPTSAQPVHAGRLVQDGDRQLHQTGVKTWRMGSVDRLIGRLSPHTDASAVMAVSSVCHRRGDIRVPLAPLRVGIGTVRLHTSDENGVLSLPSRGTSVPRVPRRLTMSGQHTDSVQSTGGVNNVAHTLSRFFDKRQEIRIDSVPGIHFPGSDVRSCEGHRLPCPTQIADFSSAPRFSDETNGCNTTGSPQASRPYGILLSPLARGESGSTRATVATVAEMGQQPLGHTDFHNPMVSDCCLTVVAGGLPDSDMSSAPPPTHADTVYRCLQHGLGGPSRRTPGFGEMGAGPQGPAYQFPRNGGCPSGSNGLPGHPAQPGDTPQDGQLNSCRLYKQRGGAGFLRLMQTDPSDTAKSLGQSRSPGSPAHSGHRQRLGGCPEQEAYHSPNRMDNSHGNTESDIRSLGETSHRSVCHQAKQQTSSVRVTSPRSTSGERRCSYVRLDGTGRICFSSAGTAERSAQENTIGKPSNNITSSQLASPPVVHTTVISTDRDSGEAGVETRSSHATSVTAGTSETGCLQASRLETVQQSLRKRGFSERVSSSVARARRTSTERVYQAHWRCWVDWAERRQVDPGDPPIPQLCEFLMYLIHEKKFTQGTVKSYRSAICTTIRQSGGPDLSVNPILRELVNSLKINAPKAAIKVPQWDVFIVLEALKGPPFEPANTCDAAHWSYKTAFLLALATAKRRSELHAIDYKAIRWEKDMVHLSVLPDFVAKNQRPGESFPPIVVPSLAHTLGSKDPNRSLCPFRALKWYLEKSSTKRSSQRRLFISFTKTGKEIAAPTLSRWIVKAVTIALDSNGELECNRGTPRAHEVRAIATSLARVRAVPMENILRAAFWRNESTFSRFYLRDMTRDSNGIARLPVVAAQQILH